MNRLAGRAGAAVIAFVAGFVAGPAPARADGFDMHVLGDADAAAVVGDKYSPYRRSFAFEAGSLDLKPSFDQDRTSVVAEILFRAEDSGYDVDVARAQVAYVVTDWLRIRAGRMHTAFGYYNDTYHYGRFFELTTARPHLASFEEPDGGPLEMTFIGVGVDGRVPLGHAADLLYAVDFGNGRGHYPGEVVLSQLATSPSKMLNVRLRLRPRFLDGLMFGVNAEVNEVPDGASDLDRQPGDPPDVPHTLREYDAGFHAAYMESGFHLLGEAAHVRHVDTAVGTAYDHDAAFGEVGYAVGRLTPYGRYEVMHLDANDPYYQLGSLAGTRILHDVRYGLKWEATDNVAIKAEAQYRYTNSAATLPTSHGAVVQVSFAF